MKDISTTTKKVIKAFQSGRKLSSAKMRDMGVANPSATVTWLRNSRGMAIVNAGGKYYTV